MKKGKTESGFDFEILDDIVDDYELVESLAVLDMEPLKIVEVVERVLGKEQTAKLKNHVRTDSGRVSTQAMSDEILEIFKKSGSEAKNS